MNGLHIYALPQIFNDNKLQNKGSSEKATIYTGQENNKFGQHQGEVELSESFFGSNGGPKIRPSCAITICPFSRQICTVSGEYGSISCESTVCFSGIDHRRPKGRTSEIFPSLKPYTELLDAGKMIRITMGSPSRLKESIQTVSFRLRKRP